jgi:hypothetical protein
MTLEPVLTKADLRNAPQHREHPMRDLPAVISRGNNRHAGDAAYRLPDMRCATCLQSTRGFLHGECRRDPQGRLLVVEEAL